MMPHDDTRTPVPSEEHHSERRDGFALPMAILTIAFLTVTVAATYSATSSELTTITAQRGESRAYMIAQAGLENFMARRNETGFCPTAPRTGQTTPPCGYPPVVVTESTTVTVPGGYAEVVARRVRVATLKRPAIYLMRSHGVDTSAKGLTGSSIGSFPERTVAQLVYWNVNQVQVLSGWTSASGLDKTGSSGTISGADNNTGLPGCPPQHDSVAGIAVPTGDYSNTGNFTPIGSPPIQFLGDTTAVKASIKIDWDGIVNGDRIQPDFEFANGAAATSAWPSFTDTTFYPVIRVDGDLTLSTQSGRGTLIVLGNLTISGNDLWKGIILVGGTMTSNGNNTMLGATMSGLNSILTQAQIDSANATFGSALVHNPANALAKGTKTFQYDSCQVSRAASGLASYSVYPNAWMDNFVTY
jgi:hypothetical protein